MSVAEKITRLTTARSNIRNALANKGITASTHGFEDFSGDIGNIQTGITPSGNVKYIIPIQFNVPNDGTAYNMGAWSYSCRVKTNKETAMCIAFKQDFSGGGNRVGKTLLIQFGVAPAYSIGNTFTGYASMYASGSGNGNIYLISNTTNPTQTACGTFKAVSIAATTAGTSTAAYNLSGEYCGYLIIADTSYDGTPQVLADGTDYLQSDIISY